MIPANSNFVDRRVLPRRGKTRSRAERHGVFMNFVNRDDFAPWMIYFLGLFVLAGFVWR
jgi:hypothetical protein